jgi:hypothetical protein
MVAFRTIKKDIKPGIGSLIGSGSPGVFVRRTTTDKCYQKDKKGRIDETIFQ